MVLPGRAWPPLVVHALGVLGLLLAAMLQDPWVAGGGLLLSFAGEYWGRLTPELRSALARSGFGPRVRLLARALLLLVACAPAVSSVVQTTYVTAVLAIVACGWLLRFVFERAVDQSPPIPLRNLGNSLGFPARFERFRRARTDAPGAAYFLEFPLGLLLILAALRAVATTAAVLTLTVLVAAAVLASVLVAIHVGRYLRTTSPSDHFVALHQTIEGFGPEVLAYFSGPPDSSYWINQWLPALNQLDRRVVIVAREAGNAAEIGRTHWPIVLAPRTLDIEVAVVGSVKVALYFGNSGRNVHMLRYPLIKHAFLNHGDSDKASSATPVTRVYDKVFVAGEGGIDRYHSAGVDIPRERFAIVGRPQLDRLQVGPRSAGGEPPTVLYAPTFEGFFEDINYSSLATMGPRMIERLLDHPDRPRVIFKPHPYTGQVNRGFRRVKERIEAMLRAAGRPHMIADDSPEVDLFDWFDHADVLVADISAVITDFLHTERPYLLTNPRDLAVDDFTRRFPNHRGAYLIGPNLETFDTDLASALGDDPKAEVRREAARYLLGDHPHGAQRSFVEQIDTLIEEALARRSAIRSTFSFGD